MDGMLSSSEWAQSYMALLAEQPGDSNKHMLKLLVKAAGDTYRCVAHTYRCVAHTYSCVALWRMACLAAYFKGLVGLWRA